MSRYATIREHEGTIYIYMKTAERAHTPALQWERIQLSKDYEKALEEIDQHLLYWPEFLIHKCKQRLTKLTQYLIRSRKLARMPLPKLQGVDKNVMKREKRREARALVVARLEHAIENELLNRLRNGSYGEMPLNVNEDVWQRVLESRHVEEVGEQEAEAEKEYEREFISDIDLTDDEDDVEDFADQNPHLRQANPRERDIDSSDVDSVSGSEPEQQSNSRTRNGNNQSSEGTGRGSRRKQKGRHVEIEYETLGGQFAR